MKALLRKMRLAFELFTFAFLNRIYCIFLPMNENCVLFLSEVRDVMGGNLLSLYNELEDTRFQRIVSIRDDKTKKRSLRTIHRIARQMATSKYIILDDFFRALNFAKIRKSQQIVQLWHGAGAFKNTGYLRENQANNKNSRFKGHKHYTLAITSSESCRQCVADSFNMPVEKIFAGGYPRMDIFFDKEYVSKTKEQLYDEFPFLKGKKVILFAPTYRGDSVAKATYDYQMLDMDKIFEQLKDEYIFVFKWHPANYNNLKASGTVLYDEAKYPNFFYDLSSFRDINDLLLVCDILVTDYSSVIFEYALLNKPIIHFVYDKEAYEKNRGLYYAYDKYVYGGVAEDCDGLIECIKKADMEPQRREAFNKLFISACDGKSTVKTAKRIFGENYKG